MPRFVLSGLGRPRKLRATDADRDAYADIVSKGYAEGQLDATTFEYRSSKVLNAKTVGELDDLVADLITPETGVKIALPTPVGSSAAAVGKAVKIGSVVTGAIAVIVVAVVAVAISAGTQSSAIQPDPPGIDVDIPPLDWQPVDMYSPEGLQQVVDEIVAVAGPDLTWLGLYGEYALATAPGAEGATRLADYHWSGPGQVSKSPGGQDIDHETLLFDVNVDVDLAAIAGLATDAPRLTGVLEPTSVYVSVDRSLFGADHLVEMRVSLSNDYQDGYLTADRTGEIITIQGPGVEPDTTRFFKAANAAKALEAMGTRLGHDEVTEVRLYGEYVAAEAPPEAGATVVDSYEFRGGSFASKETFTPIQPEDVRAAVFSLASIDAGVVAQVITEAVAAADVADGEVSYVHVQRPRRPEGHDAVIVVDVYNDYESVEVIYSLTGELLQVS